MSKESYIRKVFSSLKYEPTELQWPIHLSEKRIKLVAGGWRAGKSHIGAKEALLHALTGDLIWLVAPTYDMARSAEFKYLVEDCQKLGLIKPNGLSWPLHGSCSIELVNKCRIVTKSATDPQGLGMEAPDCVIGCEAAQFEFEVYSWLRGRIAEKRAPLILTGTFESSVGWYVDFYNRWLVDNDDEAQSFSLPSWSNTVIYPLGENDPEILRIKAQEVHDVFMEKYAGVPVKLSNLVLPEFSAMAHVGKYEFDRNLPVEIAVDPGYRAACAVEAIQIVNGIPRIVDEVYLQGYITEDIITVCQQRPWWSNVHRGVIDVAGRYHGQDKAPVEVWRDIGHITLDSQKVEVDGGIDKLRTMLKINPVTHIPGLLVNYSCRGFISECGGCKSPIHGGGPWLRDKNTGKPLETNDHATKAVAYWLVDKYGYSSSTKRRIIKVRHF